MYPWKPNEQVVFRVENEFLIGEIAMQSHLDREYYHIREGGKLWLDIHHSDIHKPEEVMK